MYQRVGKAALKPDLSNTKRLLEALGNPHTHFRSIHIAGTNGKGSSAHAISSILQEAGYKTGLYTSPHLKSFTERIRINGSEISQDAVVKFVSDNRSIIEEIQPSFFELTVAMSFLHFFEEKVDIAVIEVGLGGRLDSTNVIVPEVSLITNIGFDHMDLLGYTLPEIAREKAGIIKKSVPVVIGSIQPETLPVFTEISTYHGSPMILCEKLAIRGSSQFNTVSYGIDSYELDIQSDYYVKNIPGVIETIVQLNVGGWSISTAAIKQGLKSVIQNTGLKGRFQIMGQQPLVIADVSHNEPGLKELLNQIYQINKGRLHLIYGTVVDKDLTGILQMLPKDAKYYFTESSVPRSLPVGQLSEVAKIYDLVGKSFPDVNQSLLEALKEADPDDTILVTGSTFVVAELNEL
ncbi:MAG: dihydrofolate synthase/folylpolyglutamate synthase [Cyclobacteriaceae bacterium]|jgi:dihydrofolate synthase/folylpolyglutamate synthase